LPGFFSIPVVTSSDRGKFLCLFSFNFRGFSRGDGGLILTGIKGMKGMGEEPNQMIARKPGPLNPPKLYMLRFAEFLITEENLQGSHLLSSRYR
jgi:hypothetical protein